MVSLKIIKFPDPVLQRRASSVEVIRPEERALVDNMLETMYLNQGVGLAASLVSVLKRIIVVDVGGGPIDLINPAIAARIGSEKAKEGCLSLPGIMVPVRRAKKIRYKCLNRDGKLTEGEAEGLLARAIQHEIDHLEGRLIIDYVNPVKRFFLKKKILKNPQP